MNILVLNCGSSSLKFQLIETDQSGIDKNSDIIKAKGTCERIGSQALITLEKQNQPPEKRATALKDHVSAINYISQWLLDASQGPAIISSIKDIDAVGHRVVHGGEQLIQSAIINTTVLRGIEDCIELAPLHNPANLAGIKAVTNIFGSLPQVAVFDTAFHASMPDQSFLYSIPYQFYRRYKIRRYGFHGTSHRYVAYRYRTLQKKPKSDVNVISLHLGNGCSSCLVVGGVSQDTSMGMTPMEGLTMGTRCGDIDPAIVEFIMEKEGLSVHEVMTLFNKQSGLLGVSGLTHDMRELLEEEKESSDRRAHLAINIFVKKIREYIGAHLAQSPETQAVILCGGIGENSSEIRSRIFSKLDHFGFNIDEKLNKDLKRGADGIISKKESQRLIYVIPTNEELLIARDTYRLVAELPNN